MNKDFFKAIEELQEAKGVSKESVLEGVKAALLKSCEQNFGPGVEIVIDADEQKGTFRLFRLFHVVEEVEKGMANSQILPDKAQLLDPGCQVGDTVRQELDPKNFTRIAAQNGKSIILQKIREEERESVNQFFAKNEKNIMSGVVSRVTNNGMVAINFGKGDGVLSKEDMIPGEVLKVNDRVKVFVVGMVETNKGKRVKLSRISAGLVKRLFEQEVTELQEGKVEIKGISREAGSRTKMSVYSNDASIDPIGACIGLNGARINAVVDELNGEKIDIINWNEDPALLVENALSPAKVIAVAADEDERTALVVVPDNQLSLAIGMKGQNARLAAKLTGYKIDIKSESQAREEGLFDEYDEDEVEEESEE